MLVLLTVCACVQSDISNYLLLLSSFSHSVAAIIVVLCGLVAFSQYKEAFLVNHAGKNGKTISENAKEGKSKQSACMTSEPPFLE